MWNIYFETLCFKVLTTLCRQNLTMDFLLYAIDIKRVIYYPPLMYEIIPLCYLLDNIE